MGKIAFVFSGQGAQYSGMGRELCEVSPSAKKVFDTADFLRPGTSKQCFEAPKDELSLTINTQPCLFCTDLAAAEALKEAGIIPDAVAGFSLGEIAALTFAGILSGEEGFSFVCRRGEAMHKAAEKKGGGMMAVVKLDNAKVEELCAKYSDVFPVNYNCPGQLVVAGGKDSLKSFAEDVKAAGGKGLPLAVSGAFHSPFMAEAVGELKPKLNAVELKNGVIPVYSNYTAQLYPKDAAEMKELILNQIDHPVRWQQIIEAMHADGFDIFIEVGAGKTLVNLINKILPDAKTLNVENKQTLESALLSIEQTK